MLHHFVSRARASALRGLASTVLAAAGLLCLPLVHAAEKPNILVIWVMISAIGISAAIAWG